MGVKLEDSRTAYETPGKNLWNWVIYEEEGPPDPNASVWLCRGCATEHHEYWDDMWREYHSGLGV